MQSSCLSIIKNTKMCKYKYKMHKYINANTQIHECNYTKVQIQIYKYMNTTQMRIHKYTVKGWKQLMQSSCLPVITLRVRLFSSHRGQTSIEMSAHQPCLGQRSNSFLQTGILDVWLFSKFSKLSIFKSKFHVENLQGQYVHVGYMPVTRCIKRGEGFIWLS